jgi:hypothetical protein
MKYLFPAIITIPTVILTIGIAVGIIVNQPFFESLGIPLFIGFIPFLSFATSVALIFVFPNSKEWKVAAILNGIPFALLLLLALFWSVTGYHG